MTDNDLIRRQAVIDEVQEWIDMVYAEPEDKAERIALLHVLRAVKRMPAAGVPDGCHVCAIHPSAEEFYTTQREAP